MALDWLNRLPADKIMELMAQVQEMEKATYDHVEALDKDKIKIREEIKKFIYEKVVAVQKAIRRRKPLGLDFGTRNSKEEAADAGLDTEELNRVSKTTLRVVSTLMDESGRFKGLVDIPEKPDPLFSFKPGHGG